jgi:hypothetical protein
MDRKASNNEKVHFQRSQLQKMKKADLITLLPEEKRNEKQTKKNIILFLIGSLQ